LYFFTFGLLGCGFLIDMFRMPCLVKQANKRQREANIVEEKTLGDAYTLWFPFGLLGIVTRVNNRRAYSEHLVTISETAI